MAPTLMPASMPSKRMGRGDDHRGWSDEYPGGGRSAILTSTLVQVAGLAIPGALIEIEAVAVTD